MIVPITDLDKLPDHPGIYYVRDSQDNIIYIGKATSIKTRWEAHKKLAVILNYCQGSDATIETHKVSELLLRDVESIAIAQHDPVLNKQKPTKSGNKILEVAIAT